MLCVDLIDVKKEKLERKCMWKNFKVLLTIFSYHLLHFLFKSTKILCLYMLRIFFKKKFLSSKWYRSYCILLGKYGTFAFIWIVSYIFQVARLVFFCFFVLVVVVIFSHSHKRNLLFSLYFSCCCCCNGFWHSNSMNSKRKHVTYVISVFFFVSYICIMYIYMCV